MNILVCWFLELSFHFLSGTSLRMQLRQLAFQLLMSLMLDEHRYCYLWHNENIEVTWMQKSSYSWDHVIISKNISFSHIWTLWGAVASLALDWSVVVQLRIPNAHLGVVCSSSLFCCCRRTFDPWFSFNLDLNLRRHKSGYFPSCLSKPLITRKRWNCLCIGTNPSLFLKLPPPGGPNINQFIALSK